MHTMLNAETIRLGQHRLLHLNAHQIEIVIVAAFLQQHFIDHDLLSSTLCGYMYMHQTVMPLCPFQCDEVNVSK